MYYKKYVNISKPKSMFKFLKDHLTYYVQGGSTIANNVKIPTLKLEGDADKAYKYLHQTQYSCINKRTDKWEKEHPDFEIYFAGRSGGHLVLVSKPNITTCLPHFINLYTYEQFKSYCKENYGSIKAYLPEMRKFTIAVRDFDRLCDELRNTVNYISKNIVEKIMYHIDINLDAHYEIDPDTVASEEFAEELASEWFSECEPELKLDKVSTLIVNEEEMDKECIC